jgi:hypothetical protein
LLWWIFILFFLRHLKFDATIVIPCSSIWFEPRLRLSFSLIRLDSSNRSRRIT